MSILVDRFFARKDYEGLSEEAAKKLREERRKLAESLRAKRSTSIKYSNKILENGGDSAKALATRNKGYNSALEAIRNSAKQVRESIINPNSKPKKQQTTPGSALPTSNPSAPTTPTPPAGGAGAGSIDEGVKKQILDEAAGKGEGAAKDAAETAAKKGEQAAKQSEGFLTRNAAKVENWYKGLSKTGKAGVIGAGLLGVGLAGYGAANAMNKKDRAYSSVSNNNMYSVRRFSMEDEARARREARRGLRLQDSHRGLGRSLLLGGPEGAYGAYISKGGVDEDYENGLSEAEIVNNAAKRGAKWGAGIGGSMGLLGGTAVAAVNPRNAVAPITYGSYGAIRGGLGGYFGAKKNARTRLDKPRIRNYE